MMLGSFLWWMTSLPFSPTRQAVGPGRRAKIRQGPYGKGARNLEGRVRVPARLSRRRPIGARKACGSREEIRGRRPDSERGRSRKEGQTKGERQRHMPKSENNAWSDPETFESVSLDHPHYCRIILR